MIGYLYYKLKLHHRIKIGITSLLEEILNYHFLNLLTIWLFCIVTAATLTDCIWLDESVMILDKSSTATFSSSIVNIVWTNKMPLSVWLTKDSFHTNPSLLMLDMAVSTASMLGSSESLISKIAVVFLKVWESEDLFWTSESFVIYASLI